MSSTIWPNLIVPQQPAQKIAWQPAASIPNTSTGVPSTVTQQQIRDLFKIKIVTTLP